MKSIGLVLKFLGEPLWCFLADLTDPKIIFSICIIMQIGTMEMMRRMQPLSFSTIAWIKILRTATAPSSTLTTTASFKLTEGTNEGYGKQRTFGSLAWGCGAFVCGYLIDAYGMDSLFYYTYFFNLVSFFAFVFGIPNKNEISVSDNMKSSNKIVSNPSSRQNSKDAYEIEPFLNNNINNNINNNSSTLSIEMNDKRNGEIIEHINNLQSSSTSKQKSSSHSSQLTLNGYLREIRRFLMDAPCRVLLCNAFMYGIVMTVPDTFLFISLEKDFGASRTFAGLCTTTSIIACMPIFWHSEQLITNYGHYKMILLAEMSCVLRLLAYALCPTGWPQSKYIILVIQLIHGVNFALFWSAIVDAMYKFAPKDLSASCMATLNIVYFTLSAAIGNIMWGVLYDISGGVITVYVISAIMLAISLYWFQGNEALITNSLL